MNRKKIYVLAAVLAVSFYGKAQVVTIDAAKVKQVIDGFGASSAWHGQLTIPEVDAAFRNDNSNQLGLSILRVRIDPNPVYWGDEKANAQRAKTLGVKILASPWTPPASMKTNNNVVGGYLKTDAYASYATHLKSFCNTLGTVDVVSLQNEPNISVNYESCSWTPTQLLDFCKNSAQAIGKPVMMPEAFNFDPAYSDPTLNDSTASSHISYLGGHIYGSTPFVYTNAIKKGKKVWMTEHYYDKDDIATCLTMDKEIVDCMVDNMNAYIWWWLRLPSCNLMNSGGPLKKKGYAFAHFSKFVRPGYYRIDATYQSQYNVFTVAFKGKGQTVVVVVNQNSGSRTQTFLFKNDTVQGMKKFVTSASKSMSDEGKLVCSGNSFTDKLEAQSVTTYISTEIPTGIEPRPSDEIRIFPNPASDYLQLSSVGQVSSVQIVNLWGQQMVSIPHPENPRIDISHLPEGFYFISIVRNGSDQRFKFLKVK